MPDTQLPALIDAAAELAPGDDQENADAIAVSKIFDFMARVFDYSVPWIQLLARVGDDDLRALVSEEQADQTALTAEGFRAISHRILVAAGEVIDPSITPGPDTAPPAVDEANPGAPV